MRLWADSRFVVSIFIVRNGNIPYTALRLSIRFDDTHLEFESLKI